MTNEILKTYPDALVHAVDASPGMIDIVQSHIQKENWDQRVQTAVMSGQDLRFRDATFDASVTNFGIFFFPDPAQGMKEIYRTLKDGGVAVVTCWKELGFMPIYDEVERIVGPSNPFERPPFIDRWGKREML